MINAVSAATAIAALSAAMAAAAASNHGGGSSRNLSEATLLPGSSASSSSNHSGTGSRRNHSGLLAVDHLPLQLTTAKVDLELEIDIQLLTNGYDGTTPTGGAENAQFLPLFGIAMKQ
ncbi:hypothetical protein AWZ03_010193 [Drosophila navojoa]|uniref:Secreted protein n=1 Tax=Drosophila navojoa TaxID=7232 RepID=A0A484B6A0_DRONA|nr:hypothetical protein AWZ03_010193 [Drosophila navojoa]